MNVDQVRSGRVGSGQVRSHGTAGGKWVGFRRVVVVNLERKNFKKKIYYIRQKHMGEGVVAYSQWDYMFLFYRLFIFLVK